MRAASQSRGGGDLEILEEKTMAEVPRGRDGRETLRLRFIRAKAPDGKEVAWHDLREFYRGEQNSEWRPGKKGISIRGRELGAVAVGLLRACASRVPAALHPATKDIVAALLGSSEPPPVERAPLPHEIYDQRRGREPR